MPMKSYDLSKFVKIHMRNPCVILKSANMPDSVMSQQNNSPFVLYNKKTYNNFHLMSFLTLHDSRVLRLNDFFIHSDRSGLTVHLISKKSES